MKRLWILLFILILYFLYTWYGNKEERRRNEEIPKISAFLNKTYFPSKITSSLDTLKIKMQVTADDFRCRTWSALIREQVIYDIVNDIKDFKMIRFNMIDNKNDKLNDDVYYDSSMINRILRQYKDDTLLFNFKRHLIKKFNGTKIQDYTQIMHLTKDYLPQTSLPDDFVLLIGLVAEQCQGKKISANNYYAILKATHVIARAAYNDKVVPQTEFNPDELDYFIQCCNNRLN